MEYTPNLPETNESDDSDDSKSRSKKKRAGALGAFVVEPKAEEKTSESNEKEAKSQSVWEKLLGGDDKEKSEPKEPETESVATEVEEADEAAAPLESLGDEETRYAEQQIAANLESPAVEAEPGDDEAVAAAAAQAAVENFRAKITEEHKPAEQAYQETLQEIETEAQPEAEEVSGTEEEPREFDEEPIVLQPEAALEDTEEDEAVSTSGQAAAPTAGGAGAGAGSTGSGSSSGTTGSGSGGGGGTPPRGPLYGAAAAGGGPGSGASRPAASAAVRPNMAPVYDPNTAGEPAGSFLVGGILGYLIGRRRGRIKTERRLLPIQQKLEKQVEALRADMIAKEDDIRKKALEQRFAERHGRKPAATETVTESAPSGRVAAPEARKLHAVRPKPERIGKVLVAAEAAPTPARSAETTPTKPKLTEADVQTMDREELLTISETVVVAGSTLRQIYETHLLGERGLRRLVAEHLQGKDIKRSLRQELIERQIDFERDPLMRDKATPSDQTGGGASKTFSQLLKSVNRESDQAENEKAVMLQTQAEQAARRNAAQQKQRRVADTAMAAVIAALVALITFLIFSRS